MGALGKYFFIIIWAKTVPIATANPKNKPCNNVPVLNSSILCDFVGSYNFL